MELIFCFVMPIPIHLLFILQHWVPQLKASCSLFVLPIWWSEEDELRSFAALGQKLLCSLAADAFCICCQAAAGWPDSGWGESCLLVSLWALHRHLTSPLSLMLRKWIPVFNHPLKSLSDLGRARTSQFVMFPVRISSCGSRRTNTNYHTVNLRILWCGEILH